MAERQATDISPDGDPQERSGIPVAMLAQVRFLPRPTPLAEGQPLALMPDSTTPKEKSRSAHSQDSP